MAATASIDAALAGAAGERATKRKKAILHGTINPGSGVAAGGPVVTAAILNTALVAAGYQGNVSAIDVMQVGRDETGVYFGTYIKAAGKVITQQVADEAEATGDLSAVELPFTAVCTTA